MYLYARGLRNRTLFPLDKFIAGCFKLCGPFIGVFGNLDESEQAGVYRDFIFFQFFLGQTFGMLTNKRQIGSNLFEVVSVVFLVIHKS